MHSDELRNAASPEISTVRNLEVLGVFAVSAVHQTEVLLVHEVPAIFLSKILHFTPRYWEHLWDCIKMRMNEADRDPWSNVPTGDLQMP